MEQFKRRSCTRKEFLSSHVSTLNHSLTGLLSVSAHGSSLMAIAVGLRLVRSRSLDQMVLGPTALHAIFECVTAKSETDSLSTLSQVRVCIDTNVCNMLYRYFDVMLIGRVVHLTSTQYYPMHNFISRAEPLRCALADKESFRAFSFGTHGCESFALELCGKADKPCSLGKLPNRRHAVPSGRRL
jgi:hypothetical protein